MATAVEEKQPDLETIAVIPTTAPVPPTTTATSSCTNPYEENSGDQFEKENSATVKYLGPGATGGAATDGKTSGSDVSPSGSENHHKTEGSIIKATHRLVRQENNRMPYNQLLQMVARLEGELQARDVVIACLRNERVKSLLNHIRTRPDVPSSDPFAALFRDKLAIDGNFCNRDTSSLAVQAENEANLIINEQIEILYDMVTRQRQTHNRMVHILTESLENNQRMRQELEEEKRKHEHDTAQGDDITYGLEIERTKLKQELEAERNQKKKLEKDLKKLQETLEFERNREKQMVLYLMAERKAIIKQYVEEGKKSQDLAQILNEEKQRSDTIAEGLEEESKKSSRIEAELEDKVASFDTERKQLKLNSAKDDKRIKELEGEVLLLRNELDTYRKKLQQFQPSTGTKARDEGVGMANVAKVVQPTATVSSVPVSGPTTGIARSLSVASGVQPHPPAAAVSRLNAQQANAVNQPVRNPNVSPPPKATNATGTILRAGDKQPQPPQQPPPSQNNSTAAVTTTPATPATTTTGRGQPPPIPPNKPVVPPKREPSISRLNSVALATAASVAAASSNSSPTPTTTPTATATSTK